MGSQISFEDSLERIQVPIITLNNNGKKFNFIMDTGSSTSAVNKEVLPEMEVQMLEDMQMSIGVEGNPSYCEMCGVKFTDDSGNEFVDIMSVIDLSVAFQKIKEIDGVTVHGMLGSAFFTAYGCILDYENKMIYTK